MNLFECILNLEEIITDTECALDRYQNIWYVTTGFGNMVNVLALHKEGVFDRMCEQEDEAPIFLLHFCKIVERIVR